MCYLAPPDVKRYYALAYQYSIQASNYFRLAVRDISEDNWLLIVIFYTCNGIFNFYRPFLDENVMGIPCTLTPAASLQAMRSGGQFADSVRNFLERSPIRAKLQQADPDAWARDPENITPVFLTKLARLEEWLRRLGLDHTDISPDSVATYFTAIDALVNWVHGLPGGKPRMPCHIVAWPIVLPDAYYSLLEANDPMALVLYLVWSDIMSHMPRRWFLLDWLARGRSLAISELEKQPRTSLHRLWETLEGNGGETADTGTSTCGGPGTGIEASMQSQTTSSVVKGYEGDGEQQASVDHSLPESYPPTAGQSLSLLPS